jgi:hypothetical protein
MTFNPAGNTIRATGALPITFSFLIQNKLYLSDARIASIVSSHLKGGKNCHNLDPNVRKLQLQPIGFLIAP